MLTPAQLMEQRPGFVPVTRSEIAAHLRAAGVRVGGLLLVHVRLSALGWVAGGMDAVVHALGDTVGPDGTVMAFCGWEDSPYHVAGWPAEWQQAYQDQPAFDPAVSGARRDFGRFPERLRTWPGAVRGSHPEVSFTAVGPQAAAMVADSADDDPWGVDGPLGRLVEGEGQVLMLGAPLARLTLCHHAEATARVQGKRYHSYTAPVRVRESVEWQHYSTLDTYWGALDYWDRSDLAVGESIVGMLAEQAVTAGAVTTTHLHDCPVHLVEAAPAVVSVRRWIEDHF